MLLKEQGQKLKPLIEEHLLQIVEKIGSREIGTVENDRTRAYIASAITKLGLTYSAHQMSTILRKPISWDCTLQSSSGSVSISILPGLSTLPAKLLGMKVLPNIYETREDFTKNPPRADVLF